jgi:DNA-binding transcriptional regulator YiaG
MLRITAMTAEAFRAALAGLGMTQAGFARLALVDGRTVRRWALGERDIPGPIVALLRLMETQCKQSRTPRPLKRGKS